MAIRIQSWCVHRCTVAPWPGGSCISYHSTPCASALARARVASAHTSPVCLCPVCFCCIAQNKTIITNDPDDSVRQIKFGFATVAETMPVAEKVAEEVSAIFPHPVKLEFEKVYCPYLLMNKKR